MNRQTILYALVIFTNGTRNKEINIDSSIGWQFDNTSGSYYYGYFASILGWDGWIIIDDDLNILAENTNGYSSIRISKSQDIWIK